MFDLILKHDSTESGLREFLCLLTVNSDEINNLSTNMLVPCFVKSSKASSFNFGDRFSFSIQKTIASFFCSGFNLKPSYKLILSWVSVYSSSLSSQSYKSFKTLHSLHIYIFVQLPKSEQKSSSSFQFQTNDPPDENFPSI